MASIHPLKEKKFTKQLAFDIMNCNSNKYKESAQISDQHSVHSRRVVLVQDLLVNGLSVAVVLKRLSH